VRPGPRRLVAGTGWKMNNDAAATRRYAAELAPRLAGLPTAALDLYVLPPFTSLHAAAEAFAAGPVAIGGQNMHFRAMRRRIHEACFRAVPIDGK